MGKKTDVPVGRALKRILKTEAHLAETHAKRMESLRKKKLKTIRATRITCGECGKTSNFGKFEFIQNLWYEQPHGCNGGAEWRNSETRLCHLVCPKCRTPNYIVRSVFADKVIPLIDLQGFSKSELFSVVWEKHGDIAAEQVFPKK